VNERNDWAGASKGADEPAVDPQVGTADIARPVAGKEHDQVGDLLRCGEPARRRGTGRCSPDLLRGLTTRTGDRIRDPSSSYIPVDTGPGLIELTRMFFGPNSFDNALPMFVTAALVAQ